MKIKVNGEEKEISGEMNITALLKENEVEQPDMVSVQINGEFVERDVFESTNIKENDEVEFLYFMGGGSN